MTMTLKVAFRVAFPLALSICALGQSLEGRAQIAVVAPAVREGAIELIDGALGRFVARDAATALSDQVAKLGGKTAIEDFSTRIAAEGGDAALGRAAHVIEEFGPAALTTLAKIPHPASVLKVLDELSPDEARGAISYLGRADGAALAEATDRFGAAALRLELRHPGVGTKIAQDLGAGGIAVARQLPTDQAIVLARKSSEIAALPEAQRSALLARAARHASDFVDFLESHPKFVFTVAATTILLEEKDRIFGGTKIALDAHGLPVAIVTPGLFERLFQTTFAGLQNAILAPAGLAIALLIGGWGAIKLLFLYRRNRASEARNLRQP
jgi:shikimate 5-dehydrogenase